MICNGVKPLFEVIYRDRKTNQVFYAELFDSRIEAYEIAMSFNKEMRDSTLIAAVSR